MLPSALSRHDIPSTEMPRQSSASWISAATYDVRAAKNEGRLLGKQAEVGGEVYGGGENGRKVKAPRIDVLWLQATIVATDTP